MQFKYQFTLWGSYRADNHMIKLNTYFKIIVFIRNFFALKRFWFLFSLSWRKSVSKELGDWVMISRKCQYVVSFGWDLCVRFMNSRNSLGWIVTWCYGRGCLEFLKKKSTKKALESLSCSFLVKMRLLAWSFFCSFW